MDILDNRAKVRELLKFGPDTYYFLQVIQRRKENPDLERPEAILYQKIISRDSELDLIDEKLEVLCKAFKARVYISILPRSLKRYVYGLSLRCTECLYLNDFSNAVRLWKKAATSLDTVSWKGLFPHKRCVWDIDSKSMSETELYTTLLDEKKIPVESIIPTFNGYHAIVPLGYERTSPYVQVRSEKRLDYSLVLSDSEKIDFTLIEAANTIYYAVR